jgi:hypothetical protein
MSSPTLHPHPSLEARARPCSVEAHQLVSHDVDAKLKPPSIELIEASLQLYIFRAKLGNMEPRDIAKLVSSDVNEKLEPLIIQLINGSLQTYMAKMGNMEPQHIARLVSTDVNEKLKPLVPSYQSQYSTFPNFCIDEEVCCCSNRVPTHKCGS